MDPPSKMTARTVLQSNGKPRRFVLSQPPHFRTGKDGPVFKDKAAIDAVQAIRRSDSERSSHYRSKGTRPVTTK